MSAATNPQPKFRHVPKVCEDRTGYRPPTGTWLRWVVRGKCGIRLKAHQLGGEWKTTDEYFDEWLEATTAATIERRTLPVEAPAKTRSEKARSKAVARAEAELSAS